MSRLFQKIVGGICLGVGLGLGNVCLSQHSDQVPVMDNGQKADQIVDAMFQAINPVEGENSEAFSVAFVDLNAVGDDHDLAAQVARRLIDMINMIDVLDDPKSDFDRALYKSALIGLTDLAYTRGLLDSLPRQPVDQLYGLFGRSFSKHADAQIRDIGVRLMGILAHRFEGVARQVVVLTLWNMYQNDQELEVRGHSVNALSRFHPEAVEYLPLLTRHLRDLDNKLLADMIAVSIYHIGASLGVLDHGFQEAVGVISWCIQSYPDYLVRLTCADAGFFWRDKPLTRVVPALIASLDQPYLPGLGPVYNYMGWRSMVVAFLGHCGPAAAHTAEKLLGDLVSAIAWLREGDEASGEFVCVRRYAEVLLGTLAQLAPYLAEAPAKFMKFQLLIVLNDNCLLCYPCEESRSYSYKGEISTQLRRSAAQVLYVWNKDDPDIYHSLYAIYQNKDDRVILNPEWVKAYGWSE
jgi:hypothetical protein